MDIKAMRWRMVQMRNQLNALDTIYADPEHYGMTKAYVIGVRSGLIADIQQQQITTFDRGIEWHN